VVAGIAYQLLLIALISSEILMRILCTSNPLVGHWLPMLPLARAAQQMGHDVVIATGPDAAAEIERRGFTAWSIGCNLATIQAHLRSRPRLEAETEEERTVADGLAMFADPAIGRARDLLDRTADWQPDLVVQEIYELGGTWVPARLHVLHGLGAHYPNFIRLAEIALAHVRSTLGEPARRLPMADTCYVDPFPPVLQPPDDHPFSNVIAMRVGAGEVRAGDVLPDSVQALPHKQTVYLTLGTLFNAAAEFSVPLQALRELPVNVVVTCGYGADPEAFEPLPPNVVVEQFVSQALLLPRCSAVACHAGAGTVIGALSEGVPVVCLPRGADQFANAEQVARLGAGIMLLPDQVSVESIRNATRRVLDETSYATAAAKIKSDIDLLPDPSAVVEELTRRTTGRGL
jgi:UDP:flavonoid glycosyltransferase YjiC (YdhE family)